MSIDISIFRYFLRNFVPQDIDKLWDFCPNRMLWEAIRSEDATIVSHKDVLAIVKRTSNVYMLPEPLPAFHQNQVLTYTLVSSSDFIAGFSQYTQTEPLYLLSCDFSWMIVFTTENTPDGGQLCAYVKNLLS